MKLIKPSVELIKPKGYELKDIYSHIELCGRTCYHSTDRIEEGTSEPFVKRMIDAKHYAMLEHGTVYLFLSLAALPEYKDHLVNELFYYSIVEKYSRNPYSRVVEVDESSAYITTNYRVMVENEWLDDLQFLCAPTENHVRRVTAKFICNRQVWNEFIRHREIHRTDDYEIYLTDYDAEKNFSFAQESTRYCNYSKEKFGKELTFIQPCWYDDKETTLWSKVIFESKLRSAESGYFSLLEEGWKPQQAALVLPNDIKTELVMTGYVDDSGWKHFFDLRAKGTTGAPHPQAKELAEPLMREFIKEKLL